MLGLLAFAIPLTVALTVLVLNRRLRRRMTPPHRKNADAVPAASSEDDIGATVQKTLIPLPKFDGEFIQIRSHYQAALRCGGDWWGFFITGRKMVIGVADATGHGISSALVAASAHSAFSMIKKLADEEQGFSLSPSAMLSYINRSIHESSKGEIMMTYFVAVVDANAGTITYANAAHNPPWLYKKTPEGYELSSLVSGGPRLGELADLEPIEERTLPVTKESILFFYTDGLIEEFSAEGEKFGKKRVRQLVEANLERGPSAIVDEVFKAFLEFNQGKPLDDDVTLACAKLI